VIDIQQKTMKAVRRHRYGVSNLLIEDIAVPEPKAGEVLVKIHSIGLDPGQWHLLMAVPYVIRLMGFGLRRPKDPGLRGDISGWVEKVGDGVDGWREGDEVFGVASGALSEFAIARADLLTSRPVNLDFAASAVLPVSAMTALQALRDMGELRSGQNVAIVGAGGGVGTFAVQIAKALGARVTGIASASKVDLVREIGADEVIDYTRHDFTENLGAYDLIVDTAGNRSLASLRRALTPKGTLVIVGGEGGGRWLGPVARLLRGMMLSRLVRHRIRFLITKETQADLNAVRALVEKGSLMPVIERTLSLDEAPAAISALTTRPARGKTVVTL
jgi:NADPH:quinone reductase-like Zn-dependent oxidoreductase